MHDDLNYIILERYLLQAVRAISGSVVSKYRMNFRCNVCGDSQDKKHVKRGFLLFNHGKNNERYWVYKCQRPTCQACEKAWGAERWLKFTDPFLFNCYENELKQCNRDDGHADAIRDKIEKMRALKELEFVNDAIKKLEQEKKDIKFFKPILKGETDLFKDAIVYCEKRKLPYERWKEFFVATGGKYQNRLIIPFFDDENKIHYWQGRHLYGHEPKYLNRTVDKSEAIYNFHHINKTQPVVVLEGPFDSMFVENAIATLGLSLAEKMQDQIDKLDAYYLFDNDEAGNVKARKFLKAGKFVFLWKDFLKEMKLTKDVKDINDAILKLNKDKFTFEELKKYFTNSYVDVLYF